MNGNASTPSAAVAQVLPAWNAVTDALITCNGQRRTLGEVCAETARCSTEGRPLSFPACPVSALAGLHVVIASLLAVAQSSADLDQLTSDAWWQEFLVDGLASHHGVTPEQMRRGWDLTKSPGYEHEPTFAAPGMRMDGVTVKDDLEAHDVSAYDLITDTKRAHRTKQVHTLVDRAATTPQQRANRTQAARLVALGQVDVSAAVMKATGVKSGLGVDASQRAAQLDCGQDHAAEGESHLYALINTMFAHGCARARLKSMHIVAVLAGDDVASHIVAMAQGLTAGGSPTGRVCGWMRSLHDAAWQEHEVHPAFIPCSGITLSGRVYPLPRALPTGRILVQFVETNDEMDAPMPITMPYPWCVAKTVAAKPTKAAAAVSGDAVADLKVIPYIVSCYPGENFKELCMPGADGVFPQMWLTQIRVLGTATAGKAWTLVVAGLDHDAKSPSMHAGYGRMHWRCDQTDGAPLMTSLVTVAPLLRAAGDVSSQVWSAWNRAFKRVRGVDRVDQAMSGAIRDACSIAARDHLWPCVQQVLTGLPDWTAHTMSQPSTMHTLRSAMRAPCRAALHDVARATVSGQDAIIMLSLAETILTDWLTQAWTAPAPGTLPIASGEPQTDTADTTSPQPVRRGRRAKPTKPTTSTP